MAAVVKMKTVYCLRVRDSDSEPWGETAYYLNRKKRDEAEVYNRCLGGFRRRSFVPICSGGVFSDGNDGN
jgi:hypothetical protein